MNGSSDLLVLGLGFVRASITPGPLSHRGGNDLSWQRATAASCMWYRSILGFGHTVALSIAGLVVTGLKIHMSRLLADRLELGVAAMPIAFGLYLAADIWLKLP